MLDSLVRNFSRKNMFRNSFQNYRKMKMRKLIWIICAEKAAEERLSLDVIAKKRRFAIEASLQGSCLEWEQRLIPVQNTGNIMKCSAVASDTSRTEVPTICHFV